VAIRGSLSQECDADRVTTTDTRENLPTGHDQTLAAADAFAESGDESWAGEQFSCGFPRNEQDSAVSG
jgi:hypothetical protein